MPTRSITELEELLDQLERLAAELDSDALASVSARIAKLFDVRPDEVAVLELDTESTLLRFVLPEKLRVVGSIPLTSSAALAARTVRERRSDILNNFAFARHASVFEGVPLGREQGISIQKLMSAPIVQGDEVVGVVQISRKGESQHDCGPDFKSADQKVLRGINDSLARFLLLARKV